MSSPSTSPNAVPVGSVFTVGRPARAVTSVNGQQGDVVITIPDINSGSLALGNGVSSGSVTGLGLSFTPTKAFLQILRPAGTLNIFALVNSGTLTSDGFDFELSAMTDSTDYVLDYLLL